MRADGRSNVVEESNNLPAATRLYMSDSDAL